jgi:hypothetical protein
VAGTVQSESRVTIRVARGRPSRDGVVATLIKRVVVAGARRLYWSVGAARSRASRRDYHGAAMQIALIHAWVGGKASGGGGRRVLVELALDLEAKGHRAAAYAATAVLIFPNDHRQSWGLAPRGAGKWDAGDRFHSLRCGRGTRAAARRYRRSCPQPRCSGKNPPQSPQWRRARAVGGDAGFAMKLSSRRYADRREVFSKEVLVRGGN